MCFFLLPPARSSQMPCVTSGIEISDLIATHPRVRLCSLLPFGIDSKYKYHRYEETVSKPRSAIKGQITSYVRPEITFFEHDT